MTNINWKNHLVELLVVFIGLTAAFGLNNWRDKIADAELEKRYLESIEIDLESDMTQLDQLIKVVEKNLSAIQKLDSLIENNKIQNPLEHSDFIPMFFYGKFQSTKRHV